MRGAVRSATGRDTSLRHDADAGVPGGDKSQAARRAFLEAAGLQVTE